VLLRKPLGAVPSLGGSNLPLRFFRAGCRLVERCSALVGLGVRTRGDNLSDEHPLLAPLGTAGNLRADAHLAALSIEHGAELCSADADFGRFPRVRWINPRSGRAEADATPART
jgi:hypothetical protein